MHDFHVDAVCVIVMLSLLIPPLLPLIEFSNLGQDDGSGFDQLSKLVTGGDHR